MATLLEAAHLRIAELEAAHLRIAELEADKYQLGRELGKMERDRDRYKRLWTNARKRLADSLERLGPLDENIQIIDSATHPEI